MTTPEANFALRALAARRRFLQELKEAPTLQRRVLEECLRANQETRFGREHAFASIRDIADYRKAVPIRDYDGHASWIEAEAAGQRQTLTAQPPLFFSRTSGTTGAAKKIPINRLWIDRIHFPHLLAHWGNMLHLHPAMAERPDAVLETAMWNPRPLTAFTEAQIPWGGYSTSLHHFPSLAGVENLLAGQPGHRAPWFSVPPEVTDDAERLYFRLRMAVEHDLFAIHAINPSTLISLSLALERSSERLIRDLRDGTLFGVANQPKNEPRAKELERAIAQRGKLHARDVWPNLRAIWCWKSASAAFYLPQVESAFGPDVEIHPFYGGSSECGGIAIPIDRHPTTGPLFVSAVFFEFVPAEIEVQADSPALLFDELEVGKEYSLITTVPSGLYRYDIGDVFRLLDFVEGVPRLEFVGRRGAVSSFTGEKLTERQIERAVEAALKRCELRAADYTCCPQWDNPPYYAFVFEVEDLWSAEALARLAAELDVQIGQQNVEYPDKRSSGRLGAPTIRTVRNGTFTRYAEHRLTKGTIVYKRRALQKDASILGELKALSQNIAGG